MAIIFKPSDEPRIFSTYLALPAPKPSRDDFEMFVFENGGIDAVEAMDLGSVAKAAHGATARADARKYRKR